MIEIKELFLEGKCIYSFLNIFYNKELYGRKIDLFFYLVDKSLKDTYSSKEQHFKFLKLASKYTYDETEAFHYIVDWISYYITNNYPSFYNSYMENDYFELSSDSSFLDFKAWFVFRGEDFINQYLSHGNEFLLNYIINNEITYKDYQYENFTYYLDEDLFNGNYLKNFTDCI